MQPQIFETFLQRCVENQIKVSVVTSISGSSENGYYEGIITEFDEEVISISSREDRTTIISRKHIVSTGESEVKGQPEPQFIKAAPMISPDELEELKKAMAKSHTKEYELYSDYADITKKKDSTSSSFKFEY